MAIEKLKSENDALCILNDNLKEKITELEDQLLFLQNNSVKLIESLKIATTDNAKLTRQVSRMALIFDRINKTAESKTGGENEKINQG